MGEGKSAPCCWHIPATGDWEQHQRCCLRFGATDCSFSHQRSEPVCINAHQARQCLPVSPQANAQKDQKQSPVLMSSLSASDHRIGIGYAAMTTKIPF